METVRRSHEIAGAVTAPIFNTTVVDEPLQIRVHGTAALPTLIYLPGLHGDWTLVSSFRAAVHGQARFVEFTYPRTITWSLDDYASAVIEALRARGISAGWLIGESFSSQVVWKILERTRNGSRFAPAGVILAGGFAQYPFLPIVRLARCDRPGSSCNPWSRRHSARPGSAWNRAPNCPVPHSIRVIADNSSVRPARRGCS